MKTPTLLTLTALAALATSCDQKKPAEPAPKPAAAAPATEKAAPAAASVAKPLEKLGAKIEVPGSIVVHDNTGEGMPPSYSLYSETENSEFNLMVSRTSDLDSSTMEAAQKMIGLDPNKLKKFTQQEKTKDGWVLAWEAESMMDQKPLYGIQVRRTIGGKGVNCERNVESKAVADQLLKACQTLVAAK